METSRICVQFTCVKISQSRIFHRPVRLVFGVVRVVRGSHHRYILSVARGKSKLKIPRKCFRRRFGRSTFFFRSSAEAWFLSSVGSAFQLSALAIIALFLLLVVLGIIRSSFVPSTSFEGGRRCDLRLTSQKYMIGDGFIFRKCSILIL